MNTRGLLQKYSLLFYCAASWCQRQMVVVWQWRLNLLTNIPLHFFAAWQMAAEWQSDKMVPDMDVHMKQRCVIEFLHEKKKWQPLTFTGTYWTFMETKQWMWAQWVGSGAFQQSRQWYERQAMFWTAMQIFVSTASRILVITGKNAQILVWLCWKIMFCAENLLYQMVLLYDCCSFHANK